MKKISVFAALLVFSCVTRLFAQEEFGELGAGGGGDSKLLITINADGTSQIRSETTVNRSQAEAQARMFKLMRERGDSGDQPDDSAAPKPQPAPDTKPMTDDELAKDLREAGMDPDMDVGDESASPPGDVTVTSNSVRTVRTQSFDTLAKFVTGVQQAAIAGGYITGVRMEKDTNAHLRLTLSSPPEMRRYLKIALKAWKAQGGKLEFKIVLPGKILTSDLPNTDGNSTWLAVDPTNDQSFEAYKQFLQKPSVITAELGDLKLDQPVDSKTARNLELSGAASDKPVTDAGPGFTAEAQSISVATVYYFPEGKQRTNDSEDADLSPFTRGKPGLTVQAKLFAPKGREVKAVSDVEALTATDDKGRVIKPGGDSETEGTGRINFAAGDGASHDSCSVQLQLSLPEADAQSIQELSGQAILDTVGKWNEMTVTNIEGSISNAIDLSSIAPGAKLMVTKVSKKMQQINIKARVTGPPEIRQIDIQYGNGAGPVGTVTDGKFTAKGPESVREIRIMLWNVQNDPNQPAEPPVLTVRLPQDERRERFKFKLSGLDLF